VTIGEIWNILAGLPPSYLWSGAGILVTILAAAGTAGFWLARLLHAHELVELRGQIESREAEIRRQREQPSTTISVQSIEEPLKRIARFLRTSFTAEPYIHPRVLEELRGWLSDAGPDIAAVDVESAVASNKYRDPIKVSAHGGEQWVKSVDQDYQTMFADRFFGRSASGVHAVITAENNGGSGTFLP